MDIYHDFAAIRQDNDDFVRRFHKDTYADAFSDFLNKHTPLFETIESEYTSSEDVSKLLADLSGAFVALAKEEYDAQKKAKRTSYLIDQNSLMVVYILPSIREYNASFSEPLITELVDQWNATFKQYTIRPGTFKEINAGFKRKLCYVTTAVCLSLGKDENCREISLLKHYRDTFLIAESDGKKLIDEYYDIAPTIVNRINKCADAKETYKMIYKNYISPCIDLIDENRLLDCKELYIRMMQSLKQNYLLS